jgi:hypothetical protein
MQPGLVEDAGLKERHESRPLVRFIITACGEPRAGSDQETTNERAANVAPHNKIPRKCYLHV